MWVISYIFCSVSKDTGFKAKANKGFSLSLGSNISYDDSYVKWNG